MSIKENYSDRIEDLLYEEACDSSGSEYDLDNFLAETDEVEEFFKLDCFEAKKVISDKIESKKNDADEYYSYRERDYYNPIKSPKKMYDEDEAIKDMFQGLTNR